MMWCVASVHARGRGGVCDDSHVHWDCPWASGHGIHHKCLPEPGIMGCFLVESADVAQLPGCRLIAGPSHPTCKLQFQTPRCRFGAARRLHAIRSAAASPWRRPPSLVRSAPLRLRMWLLANGVSLGATLPGRGAPPAPLGFVRVLLRGWRWTRGEVGKVDEVWESRAWHRAAASRVGKRGGWPGVGWVTSPVSPALALDFQALLAFWGLAWLL
ncbi:hypothetical protein EDB80DRAFT_141303 [Ilyonectria destructans]|nr:hypothetical protein EDB80DRAFT_141303 [Ilyonectria destructans]